MSGADSLRDALLELGLEDEIPLPEAIAAVEVRAALGDQDPVEAVSRALRELVTEGRVRLYRGRWDEDSAPVSKQEGLALLDDRAWYSFHTDVPDEQRLYFVNVANIRDE